MKRELNYGDKVAYRMIRDMIDSRHKRDEQVYGLREQVIALANIMEGNVDFWLSQYDVAIEHHESVYGKQK
jgi:flagellar biosynthesis chaperone FliJ